MKIHENRKNANPYECYGRDLHYISERMKSPPYGLSVDEYVTNFKSFISRKEYPCIGAQTAINSKNLSIGLFDKMDCWRTAKELGYGLTEYLRHHQRSPSDFLSYVAIFKYDFFEDEKLFETALWGLLLRLHELDRKHCEWSNKVGSDPRQNNFPLVLMDTLSIWWACTRKAADWPVGSITPPLPLICIANSKHCVKRAGIKESKKLFGTTNWNSAAR